MDKRNGRGVSSGFGRFCSDGVSLATEYRELVLVVFRFKRSKNVVLNLGCDASGSLAVDLLCLTLKPSQNRF